MKLHLVLCTCLLWLCTANIQAQSCCAGGGSCCCSTSGGSSILPELNQHIVGINYSYSSYNTTTYPGMNMSGMNMANGEMVMTGPGVATKGTMNTIQVFGRFNLPKRFQISVSLPVHFLKEASTAETDRSAGLGDASVMGFYSFFNPDKFFGKKSKHQLRIGIGVKAPTGKFNMTDGMFTSDLVLGTGSVDFIFNINYTYRFRKFGVSVSPLYKKNLTNKNGYRFGDNAGGDLNLFYVFKLPNGITVTPKVGARYNYMFYNVYNKEQLTGTGGSVLRANAGLDIYYKHFALSASVAPVLMSISNWYTEPIPILSFETGLYYSF
jgi:hypothetical protein